VRRQANRACLLGHRATDRLANPPVRVRRKPKAPTPVVLVDALLQPEVALLDQVQKRQPASDVLLGDRDHQSQIGLDEPPPSRLAAARDLRKSSALIVVREARLEPRSGFDARLTLLRQLDLLLSRQ
jgi:hypothetical protein